MKLEDQVVSLLLAEKMDQLGFEQESHWMWHNENNSYGWLLDRAYTTKHSSDIKRHPAYTVAELGEMLPVGIYTIKTSEDFYCWSDSEEVVEIIEPIHADTEANARATTCIYLKEKDLL